MDVVRGDLGRPVALEHAAVEVADDQVGSANLLEGQSEGIDDEAVVEARHHRREVIADALFHAEPRSHAKAGGEVDAGLPHLGRVEQAWIDLVSCGVVHRQ
jgi:hypothetical protein